MPFPSFSRVRPATLVGSLVAGSLVAMASSRYLTNTTIRADAHPADVAKYAAPKKIFSGGPAFVRLPLVSGEMENHNTRRLRFKLPNEEDISGLPLPSALLTLSWPKGSWFPVPRPYTPVSPADERGYIELLVKKYPDGKASTHLHNLAPGDTLLFAAAIPGYKWVPNSFSHITLIAGGAGITPIYQLAQGILRNPDDKTSMTLVFGVNGEQDVLLKDKFAEFERAYPGRFKAVYTVSNPTGNEYRKGYVTKELLQEVMPKGEGPTKVFVCGPPAMEKALIGNRREPGVLQQIGLMKDQIHKF